MELLKRTIKGAYCTDDTFEYRESYGIGVNIDILIDQANGCEYICRNGKVYKYSAKETSHGTFWAFYKVTDLDEKVVNELNEKYYN